MFILMGISLYTSRLVLATLGAEDYGIYNIVGSVIVLFGFINNALSGSTRRFINFSLGKGDEAYAQQTFSASLTIHFIICCVIILLGETIGLWFLNTYLNIPEARMYAANWVYQFSIMATCIGIIGTPFEASIVAYEKMSIYAYISVAEAILKLLIVFLLLNTYFDKLIYYAFLILAVNISITLCKWIYCLKKIRICKIQWSNNHSLLKRIASFSGWSLFGQIAYIGSTTGLNMIINMFYGVLLNAAIGIAQQINSAIYNFVSNFQTAFNPQLVQTYSANNLAEHRILISRASRLSFFLLFVIAIPIIFNIDFILNIWLKDVPEKTAQFAVLIIIYSLIDAINAPLWMSMQAIGKIKAYQITVSSINILNVPLAYLALKYGGIPELIYYIKIFTGILLFIYRIIHILPKIQYKTANYFKDIIYPVSAISIIVITCMYFLSSIIENDILKLIITTFTALISSGILIYYIGVNKSERNKINIIIENAYNNFHIRRV